MEFRAFVLASALAVGYAVVIQQNPGEVACVPPVDVAGHLPPDDVPAACQGSTDAFDDFSWQWFLGLTRPTLGSGKRDTIDENQPIGSMGSALLFESYKPLWAVFRPEGEDPGSYDETAEPTPCENVTF